MHLSNFTKLNKEEWNALSEYRKKEIRARHYVEDEVIIDMDWVFKFREWLKGGEVGERPEPHFDYEKTQFNGCDMLNAFMKGIEFGQDLVNNNVLD